MSSFENEPLRNLPLVTEPRSAHKPAAPWQVLLTALGLTAIVATFLFGINHQRGETAGEQTAATTPTPVAPQGDGTQQGQQQGQQQAGQQSQHPQQPPSTTGQGGGDKSGDQKDRPQSSGQKANGQRGAGQPAQRLPK